LTFLYRPGINIVIKKQEGSSSMQKKLMTAKGRLHWFLELINADVDSMSVSEIIGLWEELREIAYGSLGLFAIPDHALVKWEERKKEAKRIQNVLKSAFEKIIAVSKKPKKVKISPIYGDFEVLEKALDDLEPKETGRIGEALKCIISSESQNKPVPTWAKDFIASTSTMEMKILGDGDDVYPYFSRPEDKLLLEFSSLLTQFPLSSIQRCQREDCQKYFLRATQKRKRYCSNKCAWVVASRERRNVQPEKEREKKRESYYKKIRKQHPKAIIRKRTTREG
jgi:hypothetical protein